MHSMKHASVEWQQGQPKSTQFDDVYFSKEGGVAETEHVFLQHNDLPARWQNKSSFIIAETGFGTGLNFIITADHWLKHSHLDAQLYYYAIEKYPLSRDNLATALSAYPQFTPHISTLLINYPLPVQGMHALKLADGQITLNLLFGDINDMLAGMSHRVDAWYLDGFAPSKNPEMWSDNVFAEMARLSHPGSTFSTYTAAGFVRRGLADHGFEVEKIKGHGHKRDMLKGRCIKPAPAQSSAPWFKLPHFQSEQKTVAVVGAGIVGVTTAWALAKRGWQVSLIDRHSGLAQEASGNPAGVILPRLSLQSSVDSDFYDAAFVLTVNQLNQLKNQYDDLHWWQTGVMQLPTSARIVKQMEEGQFNQHYAQVLSAEQASEIAGIPIPSDCQYFPAAGWLSPRSLSEYLLADAKQNIAFIHDTEVSTIEQQDKQWLLNNSAGQTIVHVDAVVLANAHDVTQFDQTRHLSIQATRGQITYLNAGSESKKLRCPVCYDGYVLPALNDQHLIGATFQPDKTSVDVTADDHEDNIRRLKHALPAIFNTGEQSGRAAIRAMTADRLPMVGPVANIEHFYQQYSDLQKGRPAHQYVDGEYLPGLYVNVAHGARGLTTSFLSAELIAAQLNNQPVPVSERVQQALSPIRFVIRALKKGKATA